MIDIQSAKKFYCNDELDNTAFIPTKTNMADASTNAGSHNSLKNFSQRKINSLNREMDSIKKSC